MVLILRREFIFCAYLVSLFVCMCSEYMLHPFANRHRAIPTYLNPYMYKMDSGGEILLDRGDEYYDDSIPYDGVYIHFAKQIMKVSSRRIELYTGHRIVNCFYLSILSFS